MQTDFFCWQHLNCCDSHRTNILFLSFSNIMQQSNYENKSHRAAKQGTATRRIKMSAIPPGKYFQQSIQPILYFSSVTVSKQKPTNLLCGLSPVEHKEYTAGSSGKHGPSLPCGLSREATKVKNSPKCSCQMAPAGLGG